MDIINNNKDLFIIERPHDPKFGGCIKYLKSYKINADKSISYARHLYYNLTGECIGTPIACVSNMSYDTLHPYQIKILDHVYSILIKEPRTLYLQLNTGYGKTFISMRLIESVGLGVDVPKRILVVVPSIHLKNQWLLSCKYTVFVIKTAASKSNAFYENAFDAVILDEVHEYTSKCYKNILWLTQHIPYVIGLSATPDTGNGLDRYIINHIGEPVNCNDMIDDADKMECETRVLYYSGIPNTILNKNGVVNTMGTLNELCKDDARTSIIVDEIIRLYNIHDTPNGALYGLVNGKKYNIYVFAEMRCYLDVLHQALVEKGIFDLLIDDPEVSILRGGCKIDQNAVAKSRIILTTYGYSRRGVSYKDMTAMVLTTPRKKRYAMEQIIGRIFRIDGPKDVIRYIVDVVDIKSPFFHQFAHRKELYQAKGFKISSRPI